MATASSSAPARSRLACRRAGRRRHAAQQQQGGEGDGGAEPEHRLPSPMRHQQPAERGAEHRAGGEHQGIEAEHPAAHRFGKQPGHQRRAAADDQGRADTLQDAAQQQPLIARRPGAEQEGDGAPAQPGPEYQGMAEDIAQPADAQHQAAIGQHVADDDPLDLRQGQAEMRGDRRKAMFSALSSGTTRVPRPTSSKRQNAAPLTGRSTPQPIAPGIGWPKRRPCRFPRQRHPAPGRSIKFRAAECDAKPAAR